MKNHFLTSCFHSETGKKLLHSLTSTVRVLWIEFDEWFYSETDEGSVTDLSQEADFRKFHQLDLEKIKNTYLIKKLNISILFKILIRT